MLVLAMQQLLTLLFDPLQLTGLNGQKNLERLEPRLVILQVSYAVWVSGRTCARRRSGPEE
jgi:hypothetical protein